MHKEDFYNMRHENRACIIDAYVCTSWFIEAKPGDMQFLSWACEAGIVFG